MSLVDPLIWQSLQIYREEAINEQNPFTEDQRAELLKIVDQAEAKSKKVHHIKKFGVLLHKYDSLFEEYGGDMARLDDKINSVYREYQKIVPVKKVITTAEEMARNTRGIKNKLLRKC